MMVNLITWMALAVTTAMLDQPSVWSIYRPPESTTGRVLFASNPILRQLAENPEFAPDWPETATTDEKGNVKHENLRGGWAFCRYESDADKTVILEGRGFHSIFVNGERFVGDVYRYGILRLPIRLKAGINHLLVNASRGNFQLHLEPADGPCSISPYDHLLPELRENQLIDSFGAVVILNHTTQMRRDVTLTFGDDDVFQRVEVKVDSILPLNLTKPAFPVRQLRQPREDELDEKGRYSSVITVSAETHNSDLTHAFPVRRPSQLYRATKKSAIDGSIQYFAVVPPRGFDPDKTYSLYLSLHGAAVEAGRQAACYQPKPDAFIVAPTNRRPFGFDWQEWGRLDALETLALSTQTYRIHPGRIYLTGHSMGGHGTWYLGALYPDRFAALGPAAGWITFASYRDKIFGEINLSQTPFVHSDLENDVFGMISNYTHLPIYILHGEKDDNVPTSESHKIIAKLKQFHRTFIYHEEPNAGHWFGDRCVDWQPMIEFFRRHQNPINPLSIRFSTPNPAITSRYAWLQIHTQIATENGFSRIQADAFPRKGKIVIETDNVKHLRIEPAKVMLQLELTLQIDDAELSVANEGIIDLARTADGQWTLGEVPDTSQKGPHRNGPFKMAFDKNMVWVYGTQGSDSESMALLAKVRYDAQVWWYRGNGSVEIIADEDFDAEQYPNRNVILYGNADLNTAFDTLLKAAPIQVERNSVQIGDRRYEGDYGVFFAYPRLKTTDNLVGVVGMTNEVMIRAGQQARYFVSGVTCPDYAIYGFDSLEKGFGGVVEAGYFDNFWQLKP